MCVQNLKFVALPVPKIIKCAVPGYAHAPFSPKFLMGFYSDGPCEVCSFTRSWDNSDCSFRLGLRTPDFEEGEAVGVGMVPFERELVSSYRPSIVSFHLSLRVSEILLFLCSSTPLFPTPISSLPKISPCSPGNRWMGRPLITKSEDVGLIVPAVSFQDFQPMCSGSTNVTRYTVTDSGRTDGWTTCKCNVSVSVNVKSKFI